MFSKSNRSHNLKLFHHRFCFVKFRFCVIYDDTDHFISFIVSPVNMHLIVNVGIELEYILILMVDFTRVVDSSGLVCDIDVDFPFRISFPNIQFI